MRISIYQPAYLPWLGYIEKCVNCDIFVMLDTVSYSKNSFDNRNKILLNGKDHWLTMPIKTANMSGQNYIESIPASMDWKKNHSLTLKQAYKKAPFFDEYKYLLDMYRQLPENNLAYIAWIMLSYLIPPFTNKLGIKTDAIRSSYFAPTESKGSKLILDICKMLKATEYYSGPMGKDYLNEKAFEDAGIKIIYQTYKPIHHYSVFHQLFNFGPIL